MGRCAVIPDINVLVGPFKKIERDTCDPQSLELLTYCADREILFADQEIVDVAVDKCKAWRRENKVHYVNFKRIVDRVNTRIFFSLEHIDRYAREIAEIYQKGGFTDECQKLKKFTVEAPPRFHSIAQELYESSLSQEDWTKLKTKMSVPELGDLRLLGYAVLLQQKYQYPVFVASNDSHIVRTEHNKQIMGEIESTYDIKIGTPSSILEQIKSFEIPIPY